MAGTAPASALPRLAFPRTLVRHTTPALFGYSPAPFPMRISCWFAPCALGTVGTRPRFRHAPSRFLLAPRHYLCSVRQESPGRHLAPAASATRPPALLSPSPSQSLTHLLPAVARSPRQPRRALARVSGSSIQRATPLPRSLLPTRSPYPDHYSHLPYPAHYLRRQRGAAARRGRQVERDPALPRLTASSGLRTAFRGPPLTHPFVTTVSVSE
ncbi:hypothetical protein K438DRAFT_1763223 [Mycena galopus ATCC 62051]|nr:hypothetical protein K438DRAFT_1763223 [Mycena galopus ATCC 62051]